MRCKKPEGMSTTPPFHGVVDLITL